jgi:hypothetical protein
MWSDLMTDIKLLDLELCPNCGDFVEYLNDVTGFCLQCSPPTCERCHGNPNINGRNGEVFKSESKVIFKSGKWLCRFCIRELWIERNADVIEEYMLGGLEYHQAVKKVRENNRAVCIVCAQPIQGRNRSETLFCTRTAKCRTAKRKYLWRIQRYNMKPEEALEEVLTGENKWRN